MNKIRVGLVTAWAECGMGYLAKNWVYTFDKHPDLIEYQIYSRAYPDFTPFRWHGEKVIDGPEDMCIDNSHFWNWVEHFKPDVILFQDQNIYGPSRMQKECERLRNMGIRLINYPDWIKRGDIKLYRGLYDINLSHVKRNHRWFVESDIESPTYIPWGVIINNFPFVEKNPTGPVRFYINIGTGTLRKGYQFIPKAIERMKGRFLRRYIAPKQYSFSFITTAVENSRHRVKKKFITYFEKHPNCDMRFQTADNNTGGNFSLGDVYIYPTTKEGVGLTITEALCTGTPVVTTDYPTMNEWFTDGTAGRFIRPARIKRGSMPMDKVYIDISHLAEIMIDYIEHPEKIREQSHEARRIIETTFNWDDRDEMVLNLLSG